MLTIVLFFLSLTVQAQSQAQTQVEVRMNQLLTEAGIRAWGRNEIREAKIYCKVRRLNKRLAQVSGLERGSRQLVCSLMSIDGDWFLTSVYEEYFQDKARAISDLLSEMGVQPQGRKNSQSTQVTCKLSQLDSVLRCRIFDDWAATMP